MKGQYNIYPTFTAMLTKEMSKQLGEKITSAEMFQAMFESQPGMVGTMNATVCAEEGFWDRESRHVIFPESVEILEHLREAKIGLAMESGIQFPHESFILAFPKAFKIADAPAQGCMISLMAHRRRYDVMHAPFYKTLGLPCPYYKKEEHDLSVDITYLSPTQKGVIIRMNLPVEYIPAALQAKDYIEYADIVGNFDKTKISGYRDLNESDKRYQFELFQIVVRVGIYSVACEGALRSGYPHIRPKHLEPKGISYIDETLGLSKETRTVGMHYRSWYFRQLTHKKYYQGPHKKKPIGSRIVFVKDTMVGKEIEAETLL